MLSELYIQEIIKNGCEDSDVFSLPVICGFSKLTLEKKVTFLVGENGTGKSTLPEAVAVAFGFNPEEGSINFSFSSQTPILHSINI